MATAASSPSMQQHPPLLLLLLLSAEAGGSAAGWSSRQTVSSQEVRQHLHLSVFCHLSFSMSSTCISVLHLSLTLSLLHMSLLPRRLQGAADATGAADAVFSAQLPPVTARFNILRAAQLPQVYSNVASPLKHMRTCAFLCVRAGD